MAKQKTRQDVKGWQMDCINYEACPLCYGCRAYNPSHMKCVSKCGENHKMNVCNTQRHRADLVAKMITKERIVVSSKITTRNGGNQ